MPKIKNTADINITAGGGTINLDTSSTTEIYVIKGTATMLSNLVIQPVVTTQPLIEGIEYIFRWQAVLNITTNTTHVFVFGTELLQEQCNKQSTVIATYDGSAWVVRVMPDFEESAFITYNQLASSTINSLKSNTVTSLYETITCVTSFEAGETTSTYYNLPFDCDILGYIITTVKAVAGTDDGNINITDVHTNTTVVDVAIPASTPSGTVFSSNLLSYSYISGVSHNRSIAIQPSKTTSGGTFTVSLRVKRT